MRQVITRKTTGWVR